MRFQPPQFAEPKFLHVIILLSHSYSAVLTLLVFLCVFNVLSHLSAVRITLRFSCMCSRYCTTCGLPFSSHRSSFPAWFKATGPQSLCMRPFYWHVCGIHVLILFPFDRIPLLYVFIYWAACVSYFSLYWTSVLLYPSTLSNLQVFCIPHATEPPVLHAFILLRHMCSAVPTIVDLE